MIEQQNSIYDFESILLLDLRIPNGPLENFHMHPMILSLRQLNVLKDLVNKSIRFAKKNNVDEINEARCEKLRYDMDHVHSIAKCKKSVKQTFVYIMRDQSTNAVKIGQSKDPKYRERTLQSEKPTIELFYKIQAPVGYESMLHNHFKEFRIRGEWFHLKPEVIIDFIKSFPPENYGKV